MIEEFSKLTFGNALISIDDINLIKNIPEYQKYFEKCCSELQEMSIT